MSIVQALQSLDCAGFIECCEIQGVPFGSMDWIVINEVLFCSLRSRSAVTKPITKTTQPIDFYAVKPHEIKCNKMMKIEQKCNKILAIYWFCLFFLKLGKYVCMFLTVFSLITLLANL